MIFSPNDDDRIWREPQQNSWFRFSTPLRYVAFLIILLSLIVGLWYLFSSTRRNYNKADLALIRADDTPFKIKAKDQGVPNIKHQDKLVYGRIRNDKNEPTVEHILPDPEQPQALNKANVPSVKMVDQYIPKDVPLKKNEGSLSTKPEKAPSSLSSIEDLIEEQLTGEKLNTGENNVKGKILIQLGSLKSYEMAESEWKRISTKYPNILGNFKSNIQKVELGPDQEIYYRLRTGPFESIAKAKEICTNLKEKKVNCLVIQ